MPTTLEAEARHDVRVEDVEYQRQGGRAAAGAALPTERGRPVSGGGAGAWRRLGQQGPHRQRLHGQGLGRERHPRRLDRFPHAARGALPRLARRHQSRHPLAEGERRRVQKPAPTGSAALARRAAGTRCCWRRCGPTTRATRRCGWPTRRRSTPGSPLSFPAGACSTRCCATSSPRRPATPS